MASEPARYRPGLFTASGGHPPYIDIYHHIEGIAYEAVQVPKGKNKLIDLGEDLQASLDAFCEAHYGAPQVRVIREAVRCFITAQLDAEPELRKRYDAVFRLKIGQAGDNVRVLDVHSKGI